MEDLFNQYLIIGLGNPGQKYKDTRHNIGFKLIDTLLDSNSMSNKFKSLYSKIEINKNSIHIVKPQTFMNESGVAVNEITKFFKIKQENIIVVYDDLDLPIGNLKIKIGGGSAGHNGIKSIDKFIGTDYSRVRVGIGHPKEKKIVNRHVLEDFKDDEEEKIKEITESIVKLVPTLIDKKIDLFSSKVNQNLNGV